MPVGKPIPVKVDTRFLAGTNRNLADMVRQGTSAATLSSNQHCARGAAAPARADRGHAGRCWTILPAVCRALLPRVDRVCRTRCRNLLIGYSWPGNVRELAAWVERLYVTGLSPEALVEMLLGEVELGHARPDGQNLSRWSGRRSCTPWNAPTSTSARPPACCRSIARRWRES